MISVELRNLFRTVYFFGEKEKLNLEDFSRDEAVELLDIFLKASEAEVYWINTTGLYAQGYIVNPYEETLYFALRNKNAIFSFKHAHTDEHKAKELAQSLELDSQLDTEDVERFLHREAPWEVVVDINLYLNISKVYKNHGLDDEDMSAAFEEFVHQEFGDDSPVGLFFRFIRE